MVSKNKFRKLSLFATALTGLAILPGCSGSASSGSGQTNTTSSNGPVQITFWYGIGGELGQDVQKMVNEFNSSHPGVHVTATYQGSYSGGGPEQQKLIAAIRAGDPPDIAQVEVHSTSIFAAAGRLMNLNSLMQSSQVDNPSNFLQGMLISAQYNGSYYGVPFNRSVPVLYYNKDMFAKAHIANPPATWNDLAKDAQTLTNGSGSTKVFGFEPLVDWWPWEAAVWSGGGDVLSSDLTKATFNTAEATHILQLEQNLVKSGYASVQTGPQYWEETTQAFIHGQTAMDIDSIGDAGEVTQGVGNKFNWGTAMLPADATRAVPPGGGNIAIISGTAPSKVKAAWSFIEWWTGTPQTIQWSEMTGYMPVQQSVLTDSGYQAYLAQHPQNKTALMELKYQHAAPPSPVYLGILQNVQKGLEGIFDLGQPVGDTMNQTADQANKLLSGQ